MGTRCSTQGTIPEIRARAERVLEPMRRRDPGETPSRSSPQTSLCLRPSPARWDQGACAANCHGPRLCRNLSTTSSMRWIDRQSGLQNLDGPVVVVVVVVFVVVVVVVAVVVVVVVVVVNVVVVV